MSSSDPINRVIEQLVKIPSIGEKTAERIALHLVKISPEEIKSLCQAIVDIKNTRYCKICFNPTVGNELCKICSNPQRDHSIICVVEQSSDIRAIEQTGVYQGIYHILGGHLAPLEGIEPQHLTIESLLSRVKENTLKEVILATNPTLEGDATALYLQELLAQYQVKITRIAKRIASGSTIESASKVILTDALKDRRVIRV